MMETIDLTDVSQFLEERVYSTCFFTLQPESRNSLTRHGGSRRVEHRFKVVCQRFQLVQPAVEAGGDHLLPPTVTGLAGADFGVSLKFPPKCVYNKLSGNALTVPGSIILLHTVGPDGPLSVFRHYRIFHGWKLRGWKPHSS